MVCCPASAQPELLLAAAISPQLLTECPKLGDEEFAESVFARALGCRLQAASTTWNLIAFLIKELMPVVWKSYDLYLLSPVSSCGHEGDGDNVEHCQNNCGGRWRWRGVMIVSHCRQRTLYDTQITTEQIFGAV